MTDAAGFSLESFLENERERVDAALESTSARLLEGADPRLAEAMRYSLLAGGKRLRPILCLAAARCVGKESEAVMRVALAIEMIHTYSLVHDDLPCMDDDDLRRGRPTSHKAFGEALALLAGDALITSAFELAATASAGDVDPLSQLAVVADLARAAGSCGMVSGQVVDISSAGQRIEIGLLERMHGLKTGALIEVSLTSGARLGGGTAKEVEALGRYGRAVGLAFQVADDLLDVEGTTDVLGKTAAKDLAQQKATFPALLGLEASRARARALVDEARDELERFDERADPLRVLAGWIVERDR